ncbi:hypothetical protein NLJ89_g773 [Agrocybe chaxingu]|uniref:RecF/RecN/SMC N-terminal domain-containing protein n=1 Tax=Agrocybe chaxingu TaxID=84603 RepID=A0A9W8N1C1_9AGAR|nr:hypothetical protein NLJ89_g773 [Agrocybe chaxingu]
MPKRKDISDFEEGSSTGPKRVRLTESPSTSQEAPTTRHSQNANEHKRQYKEILSEAEFEELEKSFLPGIEERRKTNEGRLGGVADAGIIEKIELFQFMCHGYLTFEFGPQLNFIVGHNGSGKSAVLAGIAIGLGGRAAVTGRGTGVKSMIQEVAHSKAEITITLKNGGHRAYKPEVYGNKIIIIRTITQKGVSTYKIKSATGQVISNRKSDLDSICDNLNIQVGNPISILTQDAAKQFLKGSSAEYKYELFARVTRLQLLRDEYDEVASKRTEMDKFLLSKQDYTQVLRDRFNTCRKAYNDAMRVQDLRSKRACLLCEKAWSVAMEKEKELEDAFEAVASSKGRLYQIEEVLGDAEDKLKNASDKVKATERDHDTAKQVAEDIWEKRSRVKQELGAKKQEMAKLKKDEDAISQNQRELNFEMDRLTAQLVEESQNLEQGTQTQKEAARIELDKMRGDLNVLKERRLTVQSDLTRLKGDSDRRKADDDTAQQRLNYLMDKDSGLEQEQERLGSHIRDHLSRFGQSMQTVLREIDRTDWRGVRPIGPLGKFVTLEDQRFLKDLSSQLGSLLCAFAVSDGRDIQPLRAILKRTRNSDSMIVVSSGELFDYERGVPPPQYNTALRVLKITNEWVKRILIDRAGIERLFVASSREQAERVLKEVGSGDALGDGMRVKLWANNAGLTSQNIELRRGDFRQSILAPQKDHGKRLEDIASERTALRCSIDDGRGTKRQCEEHLKESSRLIKECEVSALALEQEISRVEATIKIRQEEEDADSPFEIAVLNQLLEERKEENRGLQTQLDHVVTVKDDLKAEIMGLQQMVDNLKREGEAADETLRGIRIRAEERAVAYTEAQHQKAHYLTVKEKEQETCDNLDTAAAEMTAVFTECHEKAVSLGEKPEVVRRNKAIDRDLVALDATLNRYEPAYTLEENLEKRRIRWIQFLAYASVTVKNEFMIRLSSRGYFGQIIFDHVKQTLELKTDDQVYNEPEENKELDSKRKKDVSSLSGGEKSLATLSCLLALWEACNVPIRCLDEFDVFMDNQNRRCCIKMLVDASKSALERQTIIITPLSIDNIFSEPPVVVIKQMSDPRTQS